MVQPVYGKQGLAMQRVGPDAWIARAQSVDAALLLVVDGQLDLSSYRGRERLLRGALAIRPTFDCRTLHAGPGGAAWLQLPWHMDWSLGATHDVPDVDDLLLRAGHDLSGALAEVESLMRRAPPRAPLRLHWIDDLKSAILIDPHLSISDWARAHRVSREGAARAFRTAYAVSPARFRLELRARSAWARIVSGEDPLSLIALETGFADQSHMTRAVGWLTGRSPSAWRRRY
jgi:AraC-like DNA-binding protein